MKKSRPDPGPRAAPMVRRRLVPLRPGCRRQQGCYSPTATAPRFPTVAILGCHLAVEPSVVRTQVAWCGRRPPLRSIAPLSALAEASAVAAFLAVKGLDVAVDVRGHLDGAVSDDLDDHAWVDAEREQQGHAGARRRGERVCRRDTAMDPDSRTRAALEEHWRTPERGDI